MVPVDCLTFNPSGAQIKRTLHNESSEPSTFISTCECACHVSVVSVSVAVSVVWWRRSVMWCDAMRCSEDREPPRDKLDLGHAHDPTGFREEALQTLQVFYDHGDCQLQEEQKNRTLDVGRKNFHKADVGRRNLHKNNTPTQPTIVGSTHVRIHASFMIGRGSVVRRSFTFCIQAPAALTKASHGNATSTPSCPSARTHTTSPSTTSRSLTEA